MVDKIVPERRTFKLAGDQKQLKNANVLNDRVQVRLYDASGLFGCNLGRPISVARTLKLIKGLHAAQRPEKICLDDASQGRFYAKFTYAYPTHFSDNAAAELRLAAHFGYICPLCDIREKYPMYACAERIRLGECRDEFIRQTVGATLFPELYANKGQKVK